MRKQIFTLIAALLTTLPLSAQTGAWADKMFKGNTSFDFGTVARGAQMTHSFPLTNIYAVPLEITDIRGSCSCLSFTSSKKKLEPSEVGTIDINIDGRKLTDPKVYSYTIYVTVGPQYVSTATLSLKVRPRLDVVFNPGDINFGTVPRGEGGVRSLDIDYAGTFDWQIQQVNKNDAQPFDVNFKQVFRKPPVLPASGHVRYQLEVKLKPDAPPGPFKQEVVLTTNDPATKLLTVLVSGTVQSALSVLPQRVVLGALKVGETKSYKVRVSGVRPFKIMGIDGEGDGLKVNVQPKGTNQYELEVLFTPTKAGELRKQLVIRTDMGTETAEVPVTAVVSGPP